MKNLEELEAIYVNTLMHRNLMLWAISEPAWDEFVDALARFAIVQNEQTIAGLALAHENIIRVADQKMEEQMNRPVDPVHFCPMCRARVASDGLCFNCNKELEREQRGYW